MAVNGIIANHAREAERQYAHGEAMQKRIVNHRV